VDHLGTRIMAVLVVNAVIGIVQWFVRRQIPTMTKSGQMGIYAILVPLGFGFFGYHVPLWFITLFVVGGLAELLYSVKRQMGALSVVK
jgi:hypothetical protein